MRLVPFSWCSTSLIASAALASLPTVQAWGAAGHEIVATIAQIYMHPTALSEVCSILNTGSSEVSSQVVAPPCHLSRIAAWADTIKRKPQYRYSSSLHYIGALGDHPPDTCAFPGSRGWAGKKNMNILGAIRNTTNILGEFMEGGRGVEDAEEALKFLVHFIGDVHQPLHLTGRERGGNGAKVTFDGRLTNLHSVWDGYFIAQALRTISRNYTQPLPTDATDVDVESHLRGTIYDPYVRRIIYEGFGTSSHPGRFLSTYPSWLSCPETVTPSLSESLQTFLGIHTMGDESEWDDDVLCPYSWGKDLQKLICEFPLWPKELDAPPYNQHSSAFVTTDEEESHNHRDDTELELLETMEELAGRRGRPPRPHPGVFELDTPEYAGRIRSEWLVERLLAMGGIRLAGLLNGLFLSPEELADDTSATLPVLPLW